MYKNVHIKKHERGLWFRRGDFHQLLYPGDYRIWELPWTVGHDKVEIVDLLKTRFEHPMLDVLHRRRAAPRGAGRRRPCR